MGLFRRKNDDNKMTKKEWIAVMKKQANRLGMNLELLEDEGEFIAIDVNILDNNIPASKLASYSVSVPTVSDGSGYYLIMVASSRDSYEKTLTAVARLKEDRSGIDPRFFETEQFNNLVKYGYQQGEMYGGYTINWMYPTCSFINDVDYEHIIADQLSVINDVIKFYDNL